MNSTVGLALFPQRWTRLAWRFAALAALTVGASSALAQTFSITTLAGLASSASFQDGTGTNARFSNPQGVAVNSATGDIYVADANNHAIRKVTSGGAVTLIAGGSPGTSGFADGTGGLGGAARFNAPQGVAVDPVGNILYVADTLNHAIRAINLGTNAVTTIAGAAAPTATSGSTDASGNTARFNVPVGIAYANGSLWIADSGNQSIRRLVLSTGQVTTHAGPDGSSGNVPGVSGFVNGTGAAARFSNPFGVAVDSTNVYVADKGNHAIRQIVIATRAVTTLAGTGAAGSTNSSGTSASFNSPGALAVDSNGSTLGTTLYVADSANNLIRKITISGAAVTTAAGNIALAGGHVDGLSTSARFNNPLGIALNAGFTSFYVGDTNNQVVRLGAPATAPSITSTSSATFTANASSTFTVTASGSPAPTFSITSGTLPTGVTLNTTTGVISGVPTVAGSFPLTLQASNGVGAAGTQSFTLTVNQAPQITSGSSTIFAVNQPNSFKVKASGFPSPTFSTSSALPSGVTLDSTTGVLSGTPSSTTGSPFPLSIQASNGVGTPAVQSFSLIVHNGAGISAQPIDQTTTVGNSANFSVTAVGSQPVNSYQWYRQVAGSLGFFAVANGGSYSGVTGPVLTVSGATLAMSGDQFHVVVSNGVDNNVTSQPATLTVVQAPQITSTNSTTFVVNQNNSVQLTATGSPAPTFSVTSGSLPSFATLSSSGVLSGLPTTDSGQPFIFTITATNTAGTNSQVYTLNVSATPLVPAVTTQPTNQTVGLGQTATFTVAATGNPAPSYQWQRFRVGDSAFTSLTNDGTYSGVNTATLTITNANSTMSGDLYQVIVSNLNGTTTSSTAQLNVTLGTVFSTLAGQAPIAGYADGTGAAARFRAPNAIAVDSSGTAYIADAGNHVIRKVTSAGVVTTFAGLAGTPGSADGFPTVARFNSPSAVALDSSGNLYVADAGNHTIRRVDPAGVVSTIAGTAPVLGNADGIGAAARFGFPSGIAVDSLGTVYVADTLNHSIRKITAGNTVSTFVAGTAGLQFPNGLAVDSSFNVYVADARNHVIRKVSPAGAVSTLAGLIGTPGTADGNGSAARFNTPEGVAVDSSGNVYVADTFNHTIRRITPIGDVTTIGGLAGASGTSDGASGTARFNQPYGVAITSAGDIYVADTFNHTIRRSGALLAPSITLNPASQNAAVGSGTVTFTAAASGAPTPTLQWQRQAAGTSGFVNLSNDATYSGVNTPTLTITGITAAMAGDQFQVVASNLVNPPATSSAATLNIVTAPVITSGNGTTFFTNQAGAFTVTANSSLPVTFSATGLPSWATINPTTGVISGTAPDTAGSPFTVTITANNGSGTSTATTQLFTLTVQSSNVPPTITTQPVAVTANRGDSPTLSVVATGSGAFTYQWNKDGVPINGATSSTLTLPNAQGTDSGLYTVTVSNAFGGTTSSAAVVLINTPPAFAAQPRTQMALAGGTVTFSVSISGGGATYQWRKNGVPIAGATSASYTISNVSSADAANYDVVVTNPLGSVLSSLAQLVVVATNTAPTFTVQPASQTVVAGGSVSLTAAAMGVPAPAYQWRKNGVAIAGATSANLTLTNVQAGDAATYDVVATNSAGSVTSAGAGVRVIARSYAGVYFGAFGNLGNFALFVRPDNTGVFLGYLPGATAAVMNLNIIVNDAGQFAFNQAASTTPSLAATGVTGTIAADGSITGVISGGASSSLAGSRVGATGTSQGVAGYYQAGAANSGAIAHTIAGANGQAFVVVQSGSTFDGGLGTVNSGGQVSVATGRTTITETITASSGTITVAAVGAINAALSGANETVLATQRLANISSRARVTGGTGVVIAGFVITGAESKPVLIRAVGPTLAQFGVSGALATPTLDLYRGSTVIASNTGVGAATSASAQAIAAAGVRAGAFALGAAGTDSAILTTLTPGAYTAIVSGANNAAGVVLVEVYDLSGPGVGQKLLNISTRANAGTDADTLTAGVVVTGSVPKRVLIRGVGPGLAQLGLTGVLSNPTLTLIKDGATVATNTGWTTSADAGAITTTGLSVGAFPLTTGDSAMIVSLAPGNYTAQVTSATGATGTAIVEVYELP